MSDSARSRRRRHPRDEDLRLIDTTERALVAASTPPGPATASGTSPTPRRRSRGDGYLINTQFGGHGVGRNDARRPARANDGRPGRGFPLKPGLVIAIEPWFLHTTTRSTPDADGWTLRSADGSRGAHSEHTIAVTEDGPLILTDRSFLAA